jgi:hypothetical protein
MQGIEKVFGGVLALIVLLAAVFFFSDAMRRGSTPPPSITQPSTIIDASADDVICQCFHQAMSSQYRTGFESCRAVGGPSAGDAWTAGWNARVSSKPFQASCRSYLRNI